MSPIEDLPRLREELRAETEEADRLFKERVEKLTNRKPEELTPLLAHWTQQVKDAKVAPGKKP